MSDVSSAALQELAPTGVVRATINLGNIVLAQRDDTTGALGGISVDLAHALAARLGVEVELFLFDTASKAFEALRAGSCDVGFLAIDEKRAVDVAYTTPYVIIEATYLVPNASPLRDVEDVDRDGVRIAAGKNTAYDLHLSRSLKHAKLVHTPTSEEVIDPLLDRRADAAAGVRQSLVVAAAAHTGFRIMDGRFLTIRQAMVCPKGRPAAARFLDEFIEEMKATGFVAASLQTSGQLDATVAPPRN